MSCLQLFVFSQTLIFLYILHFSQIYILENQLQLDSILVTMPKFFGGGIVGNIPRKNHSCHIQPGEQTFNGLWSSGHALCAIRRKSDEMDYTVIDFMENIQEQCNQTYQNYLSRIHDQAIYYYDFVNYGLRLL